MSAVPRQPDRGYAGLRLTTDEFFSLGETPERYELVDGVVSMSPRPGSKHQAILWLLVQRVSAHMERCDGRFFPEVDLVLSRTLVYTPDLMCFAPHRIHGFPPRLDLPPDLIVEVLSPGNREFDLTRKRDDYARFGVGEYWTVDSADGRVRCFRRTDALFQEHAVPADSLESTSLPGFTLDLRPIRDLARRS